MNTSNAAADTEIIKEGSQATFTSDVIEASRQVPVLVDFWAPWCGPCKQLGPIIEKVVSEKQGAVKLVKINVDENQAIAGQMRIQSIPAVYAFVDGQPVDGFMGALPEGEIRSFIDKISSGKSPDDIAADQKLAEAATAFEEKDYSVAAQIYAGLVKENHDNIAAITGLAHCQLELGDIEAAKTTMSLIPPSKQDEDAVRQVLAAIELAANPVDEEELAKLEEKLAANPDDHQARYDLAISLNNKNERQQALDHLLHIVRTDREWNDDAARKLLLTFFESWGGSDEMTVNGRRRLSTALFS